MHSLQPFLPCSKLNAQEITRSIWPEGDESIEASIGFAEQPLSEPASRFDKGGIVEHNQGLQRGIGWRPADRAEFTVGCVEGIQCGWWAGSLPPCVNTPAIQIFTAILNIAAAAVCFAADADLGPQPGWLIRAHAWTADLMGEESTYCQGMVTNHFSTQP